MAAGEGRDSLSIERHRGRGHGHPAPWGKDKQSHLFEKVMDTAVWLRNGLAKFFLKGIGVGEIIIEQRKMGFRLVLCSLIRIFASGKEYRYLQSNCET